MVTVGLLRGGSVTDKADGLAAAGLQGIFADHCRDEGASRRTGLAAVAPNRRGEIPRGQDAQLRDALKVVGAESVQFQGAARPPRQFGRLFAAHAVFETVRHQR